MKLIKIFFLCFGPLHAMESGCAIKLHSTISQNEKLKDSIFNNLPIELIELIGIFLLTTSTEEILGIKNHLNFAHVIMCQNKNIRIDLRLGGSGKSAKEYKECYIIFYLEKMNVNPFILARKLKLKLSSQLNAKFKNVAIKNEIEKRNLSIDKFLSQINSETLINYSPALLIKYVKERSIIGLLAMLQVVDPNIQDKNGDVCLSYAAFKGYEEIVDILLKCGSNPNIKNEDGESALMWAITRGHENIVALLIFADADVNTYDKNGITVLMQAVIDNRKKIVQRLLEAGANINAKNNMGTTALMFAIITNEHEIVKVLLESGADITIKDNNGYTALDFAKSKEIIDLLQRT